MDNEKIVLDMLSLCIHLRVAVTLQNSGYQGSIIRKTWYIYLKYHHCFPFMSEPGLKEVSDINNWNYIFKLDSCYPKLKPTFNQRFHSGLKMTPHNEAYKWE